MNSKVILCVEDNMDVQMLNKPLLEAKGFTVMTALTLREADNAMAAQTPDLIILDIHLPDGNGLDYLRKLRKTSNVPVIALTNNKEEQDVVEGFASGCDDYIPKPHSFSILYARIEALLRKVEQVPETIVKGALRLDLMAARVFLNDEDMILSQKEFSLLQFFVQNENRMMNAEHLYEKVWGQPMAGDDNAVKVTVSKLRGKLTGTGYTISAKRGEGYRFEEEK